MREIIVDRGNGAKAFVLFELTKGNIAEIKDRYILEQLRSAIDSPWSTALPDGIRSALIRSVSEEMEDRFLLENMDKDTDMSVKSAIRSAAIKVKDQHGVKNGPWTDAYGDADVLDYAYQEIFTRFSDGPGVLLDEIEIPEGYRIISGEKWASDLSGIGREWIDDIKPLPPLPRHRRRPTSSSTATSRKSGIRQPARRSCRSSICPKRRNRKIAPAAVSRTRRKRLATRLPTCRATAQTL